MARVQIDYPSNSLLFETKIKIRVTDLNYGNHLSNDSVLKFVHEARVLWLQSLDYSELDIGGCGIIMADAAIVYKKEGKLGMDISIEIYNGEISKAGFELIYILKIEDSDQELARVKTGIVCYDYKVGKVVRIPIEFLEKVNFTQS